jgi:hypothetical protein
MADREDIHHESGNSRLCCQTTSRPTIEGKGISSELSNRDGVSQAPHAADTIIATIPKNAREEIRVTLSEFKGYRRISCRVWARKGAAAVPTRAGFSLSGEACQNLIQGLQDALTAASAAWGKEGGL